MRNEVQGAFDQRRRAAAKGLIWRASFALASLLLKTNVVIFRNRDEAARLLGAKLEKFRKDKPVLLAIPRGAVPMGELICDRLGCELDVVLVRKIGAPGNAEFAIGAVSEFGNIYLSAAKVYLGIAAEYAREAAARELETIRRRRALYTPIHPPIALKGRTVIIIDDGVATGATMLSAIRSARAQGARKVVAAAPVASRDAEALLSIEADETIFLDVPEEFFAISQFYEEFGQVSDEEVTAILGRKRRAA